MRPFYPLHRIFLKIVEKVFPIFHHPFNYHPESITNGGDHMMVMHTPITSGIPRSCKYFGSLLGTVPNTPITMGITLVLSIYRPYRLLCLNRLKPCQITALSRPVGHPAHLRTGDDRRLPLCARRV